MQSNLPSYLDIGKRVKFCFVKVFSETAWDDGVFDTLEHEKERFIDLP